MQTKKPRRGVLATITLDGDQLTLRLDDLAESPVQGNWTAKDHITHKKLSLTEFKDMTLSEAELADLGGYIVARLNAFLEMGEV